MNASACRRRRQCAKCPWKITTDPYDIPNGYDVEKRRALKRTIADPAGVYRRGEELRIMACHETHSEPCIGWLANQLGPGNNIALRIAVMSGRFGPFDLDGEQHERFEDTLPKDAGS